MFNAGEKISQGILAGEQVKLNNAVAVGVRIQRGMNIDLQKENLRLRQELSTERENARKLREAQEEIQYYEELLCKPMHEMARQNGSFRKTYEEQMTIMADWMVSQKAFKELAIEFGFDKGLEPAKVIEMGVKKEIDVICNNNNSSNKTNGNDGDIIPPRREVLLKNNQLKQQMLQSRKQN